jgi:hypothetical protein
MVKFRRKSPISRSTPTIKRVGLVLTGFGKIFKVKKKK